MQCLNVSVRVNEGRFLFESVQIGASFAICTMFVC